MLALAMLALLLDGPVAPAAPGPEAAGQPPADRQRDAADDVILADLVPAPLDADGIGAIAAALAIPQAERDAVAAIAAAYGRATADAHAEAKREVRRRIAASTRAGAPGTQPAAVHGPERTAMLAASAAWRRTLAAADDDLVRRLAPMRGESATRCAGLVAHERAEARDGSPSDDPATALRLSTLIDAIGLDAEERRRIEDALDRQWAEIAAAIGMRRALLDDSGLALARMLESWGPAWRVGADPATLTARLARLEEAEARIARSDEPLRRANRAAAIALIRMLGTAAADRVRDAADRAVWPWLFATDLRLAAAAERAGELGGAELAEAMRTLLRELDARLASTRRDLGRRASEAEAAEAADEAAPADGTAIARLETAARLAELRTKRLKAVTDTASRMLQAVSADGRAKAVIDDALASARAEQRALAWEIEGIRARMSAVGSIPEPDPADGGATAP